MKRWHRRVSGAMSGAVVVSGVVAGVLVGMPGLARAVDLDSDVVISEIYGGGGNAGASYLNDYVELYNRGAVAVDLTGRSIQYTSVSGTSWTNEVDLVGSIPPLGFYLVKLASGGANGAVLPAAGVTGSINMAAGSGKVALVAGTTPLACGGDCDAAAGVVDFVGYGFATDYAGSGPTGTALTSSTSARRILAPFTNTGDNAADFVADAPSPGSGSPNPVVPACTGAATADTRTIAQIQGAAAASPLVGATVTTSGVVTAAYPDGGFKGLVIQTPGTGGDTGLANRVSSDGVFVYTGNVGVPASIGDHLQITGTVSEFNTLTEINLSALSKCRILPAAAAPIPVKVAFPGTDTDREKIESMLIQPGGKYTVSDVYTIGNYGELVLASGTTPLVQPTDQVDASDAAGLAAVAAQNAARKVILSDGASVTAVAGPVPYTEPAHPARVGAAVTFNKPMVLDYRNDAWTFEPTSRVTSTTALTDRAVFANTRTAAPNDVGGNLKVASFNVLNYFRVVGTDLGCTSDFNTTDNCDARGAQTVADRDRQEGKIVAAINSLGANVVALEEIENSVKFPTIYDAPINRDYAVSKLVEALNAKAGAGTWKFVPSPAAADLPSVAEQDFIRTAFIYKPAGVAPVGISKVLADDPDFTNAREPLAQVFSDTQTGYQFRLIANHFKSKGGVGTGDNIDPIQGSFNGDRTRQANSMLDWAATLAGQDGVIDTLLAGDYNSYSMEDPAEAIVAAGYHDIAAEKAPGKSSYVYDGLYGSLDHIYASASINSRITGADLWQINSVEPVIAEYSRYTPYGAQVFEPNTPYRASDHNPEIVGLDTTIGKAAATVQFTGKPVRPVKPEITTLAISVTSQSVDRTGPVTVAIAGGQTIGSGSVAADGHGTVKLFDPLPAGDYSLVAKYAGNDLTVAAESTPFALRVVFLDYETGPNLDAVQLLATQDIEDGLKEGSYFEPTAGLSRANLSSWLYRMTHDGTVPAPCQVKPAGDVPVSHRFCGDIRWSYSQGLASVIGGTSQLFGPETVVTREQLVAALHQLVTGNASTPCNGASGPFPDVKVSAPTCSAIAWAKAEGLVAGGIHGGFYPTDPALREFGATVFYQYLTP